MRAITANPAKSSSKIPTNVANYLAVWIASDPDRLATFLAEHPAPGKEG